MAAGYHRDAQASRAGDPILDDPTAPPDAARAPEGLREQLSATIAAAVRIGRAHVALARAELGEVASEGKRVGLLAGIALGLLFFAGLLLPVGLTLFLGEWLFGSIGWGLLLGLELAIGGAVILVLAALYVPGQRIAAQLLVAVVVGIVVAVLLAVDLPNRAFTSLGASTLPSMDPGPRPLVVGLVVGLIVGAVVGIVVGLVRRFGIGGTVGSAIGLAILGLLIGAIVAIDFSLRVAVALGLAVALALWPALVAIDTYRRGLDIDGLKKRFYPRLTIETTKETIEWVRKQRPLGPKS
ncbi:MAG: hypothetical protein ACRDGI_10840 [Candidatus Limnocylindrales bacterium]